MTVLDEAKQLARELDRQTGPEWISTFDKLSLVKDSLAEAEKLELEKFQEMLVEGRVAEEVPDEANFQWLAFAMIFLVFMVALALILSGV